MSDEITIPEAYTSSEQDGEIVLADFPKEIQALVLVYTKQACQAQKKICTDNAYLLPLSEGGYINKEKILNSVFPRFN